MEHPFKEKQTVKCVRASKSSGLEEGEIYIIESIFFGNQDPREECIKGMENTPGVTVIGVPGYFVADRFVAKKLEL